MYDSDKADRAVNFFQLYLHHTTGQWYGKPFQLLNWQEDLIRKIYGTVRNDGTRQYRRVFVFIAKKNGKSELASGISLFSLFADLEPSAEVYSSAGDREQASIVFNTAVKMIQMNKKLMKRSKIRESTKRISVPKTKSTYKVLSSETGTKHGLNPHTSIIDEVHVVSRELFEVLTQGAGAARRQPLIFMITTAGMDKNSICYEEYNYAKKVRDGIVHDDSYLPVIFEMDEKDDWKNEKNWYKANPSLGHTIAIEGMRAEFRMAMERPSLINTFRQLRLNQWVTSHSKWLSIELWEECQDIYTLEEFKGEVCYAGLDLSSTTDITAFVALFRQEISGHYHYFIYQKFWCPEENIEFRSRKDKVPYELWVKKGYLKTTEGNAVDQKFIEKEVIEFGERFQLKQLNIDRWNSSQLIQNLQNEGVEIAGFGQGFASMSTPSKEFEVLVLQNRIHHDGNPVLRWMVDNVTIRQDPAGNIKPDKSKSTEKIDGVVACIMALDGWIRQANGPSVYEKEGIKTVEF